MAAATEPNFSPLFNRFLELVKQETGRDVNPKDAIFHKKYAMFRHLRYPNKEVSEAISDFYTPTWINLIFIEGMTDDLRRVLFPHTYDFGNMSNDTNRTHCLSTLLDEINQESESEPCRSNNLKGSKFAKKTTRDLDTVLNGLERTLRSAVRLPNAKYPIETLRTIKLLYGMTKERKSHLFGLIEHPEISGKPSVEYDDEPRQLDPTEDSLLLADLIAYLSIDISKDRIVRIHQQLLNSSNLLECIVADNMEILEPVKIACLEENQPVHEAYQRVTKSIEMYRHSKNERAPPPIHESLYTYLRALQFHHFVGEYEALYEKSKFSMPVNSISSELDQICLDLINERGILVKRDTPIVSVDELPKFVLDRSLLFRGLIKSILGLETRKEALAEICSHASKILCMYEFQMHHKEDTDMVIASIADCVAALCTVRLEQHQPTSHEPRRFGDASLGKNALRFLDSKRPADDIARYSYIPHGTRLLIYLRFCEMHERIADDMDAHRAFMQFQIVRLRKFAECYSINNIDVMIDRVGYFDRWCFLTADGVALDVKRHRFYKAVEAWYNAKPQPADDS